VFVVFCVLVLVYQVLSFYVWKQLLLLARLSHRNSVHLSVRLSHGWISQKQCKLGLPNQRHMCVNNLPKVVTWQCSLPGSAPAQSQTCNLTLSSHYYLHLILCLVVCSWLGYEWSWSSWRMRWKSVLRRRISSERPSWSGTSVIWRPVVSHSSPKPLRAPLKSEPRRLVLCELVLYGILQFSNV